MHQNPEKFNASENLESQKEKENIKKVNIVIVDDRQELCDSLETLIERIAPDYQLKPKIQTFSANSTETINYIIDQHPDVVLLDLTLGWSFRLSGDEIAKVIRNEGFTGKIIFMTGRDLDSQTLKLWGGDYSLDKPSEPTTLMGIIKSCIDAER